MKEHTKIREKSLSGDELAQTILDEIEKSALGLRGEKRREFIEWAQEWWLDTLKKFRSS